MAVHFLEHRSEVHGEATSSNICGGESWGCTGPAKQIASGLEKVLLFIYILGFPLPVLQRDRIFSVVILPQFVCR